MLLGVATTSAAIATVVACGQPYTAAPDTPADAAPAIEAGTEAAAVDAAPADPCQHVRLPTPPPLDDAPGDELPPFYLAVRTTTLANQKDKIAGYDLDGVCTCDTRPNTAHDGVPSCIAAKPGCDLDGGVDNAGSVLAAQLSPFFSLDQVPQRLIDIGHRTLLIEIGRYNGKRNDKEIAFGIAISNGIRAQGCPTSKPRAKGFWTPGWCGDDVWSFLPEAVVPTTTQPLVQGLGFVHDGVISLQLQGSLSLPFDDISVLPLAGAVLTGTLTPLAEDLTPRDPTRAPSEREKRLWSLDSALVGGRMKATDLLSALGTIDTSTGDAGPSFLCQDPSFGVAKQGVCDAIDLASTPGLDFDPQAKCDSLSVGFGFVAFPALAGAVAVSTTDPNPCLPGPDGQPPDSGANPPYRCAP
ncbi:MAG: hypothetical protein QOI41_3042 [Myxococcales bacterium]|nr:hypothetical protein [Myxococcales bacterium]